MQEQTIITIVSFLISAAFMWGSLNTRIKQIEKQFNEHRDTIERLARVEEKLNLLLEHFIK